MTSSPEPVEYGGCSAKDLPVQGFAEILKGGQAKVTEAGALVMDGHNL